MTYTRNQQEVLVYDCTTIQGRRKMLNDTRWAYRISYSLRAKRRDVVIMASSWVGSFRIFPIRSALELKTTWIIPCPVQSSPFNRYIHLYQDRYTVLRISPMSAPINPYQGDCTVLPPAGEPAVKSVLLWAEAWRFASSAGQLWHIQGCVHPNNCRSAWHLTTTSLKSTAWCKLGSVAASRIIKDHRLCIRLTTVLLDHEISTPAFVPRLPFHFEPGEPIA